MRNITHPVPLRPPNPKPVLSEPYDIGNGDSADSFDIGIQLGQELRTDFVMVFLGIVGFFCGFFRRKKMVKNDPEYLKVLKNLPQAEKDRINGRGEIMSDIFQVYKLTKTKMEKLKPGDIFVTNLNETSDPETNMVIFKATGKPVKLDKSNKKVFGIPANRVK